MKTITSLSRKGGVAKTTTAVLLAIAASIFSKERVVVIDADAGQHSAEHWLTMLSPEGVTVFPVENSVELSEAVAAAERQGCAYCFIDTPPRSPAVACLALELADLVIVPTGAGLTDRFGHQDTIEWICVAGRPFLLVFSNVPARRCGQDGPDVRAVREDLASVQDHVWSGQITSRAIVNRGFVSAGEVAKELVALWTEVLARLETP